MEIRPLEENDLPAVKIFSDRVIGADYFSATDLKDLLMKSRDASGVMYSMVLIDETGSVRGMRLTFPPGNWSKGRGAGLSPELWGFGLDETAYFQSLFVDPDLTGQGWGRRLSLESLDRLRTFGAKAVVCHSWLESPNDSSGRYLRKLDFKHVKFHPKYWNNVDYQCPRCGRPCICTAEEMIKYL